MVTLNPAAGEATPESLDKLLPTIDGRIRNAVNKQRGLQSQLHRYSRLVDLERLLFLLRLLTTFNGLDASDPATAGALAEICTPPPLGDLAERASAYLSRWSAVHGGNADVYGDVEAIRADLSWLEANGFTRLSWDSDEPIDPGLLPSPAGGGVNGGYPPLADPAVFRRVFTLLRHIFKQPFDAPAPQAAPEGSTARRGPAPGLPLYQHLIDRLADIEGSYQADQEATLRKDLEGLLRPYGFAPEVKGCPDSQRQGYAIGTALLSADQLLEIHGLLKASMERLSDASQKPLLLALEERLRRAGLLDAGSAARRPHSRRAMAHRSCTEERSGTLASRDQSERIERAIRQRRRVWWRHLPDGPTGGLGQQRVHRAAAGAARAAPAAGPGRGGVVRKQPSGLTRQLPTTTVVRVTTFKVVPEAAAGSASAVVSASEANRSFSSLLRQVAQGQRFTVLSHGRPVATIAPPENSTSSRSAARLSLLTRLTSQPATGEPRSWRRDELYD